MCNLYDIGPARHARRHYWERAIVEAVERLEKPKFGLRRTDPGIILRHHDGTPLVEMRRWGLHRLYSPVINNARSDKLDGLWAGLWREKKRCLIPLSTWYEWSGGKGAKQTFAFSSPEPDAWLWAAGLWEDGESGPAYSMINRDASPDLAFVHDRMPALIEPADFESYLFEEDPRNLLNSPVAEITPLRCLNPLHHPARHTGPEPMDLLPGF